MRIRIPHFMRACVRWVWVPIVAFVLVVAVAMACAVWSPERGDWTSYGPVQEIFEMTSRPGPDLPWTLRQYDGPDKDGQFITVFGLSYYIIFPDGLPMDFDMNNPRSFPVGVGRAGFPFRCLRWTIDIRDDFGIAPLWVRGIDVTKANPSSQLLRIIPLMPEPVGMVLNVLIVSAAIVLPRMAWRGAVVFRRRRKGLCVECGYPVSDFAVCPECGKSTGREA